MSSRVIIGDCRAVLPTLEAGSVQTCVTSPPYWGLRDYGPAGQIGLEPTPAEYVAEMVAVFREVRRVLRDDGTCWLNLGDSYSGGGNGGGGSFAQDIAGSEAECDKNVRTRPSREDGVPAGNLLGVPWRVALALQDDGWLLRNDAIWAKAAPMPESVAGWRWQRCRVQVKRGFVGRDGLNGSGNRLHGGTISEPSRIGPWPDR